jgi:hypothetical protein
LSGTGRVRRLAGVAIAGFALARLGFGARAAWTCDAGFSPVPLMRSLYLLLAILLILLGLLHVGSTPRLFGELNNRALWFASGGLLIILTGVLNLLNRAYGRAARGLSRVCLATNLTMLGFSALSGSVGGASAAELSAVLGLLGATTLLSSMPSALTEAASP